MDEPIVGMVKVARDEDGNVFTVRRYSDSLLTLLLRARRPEKFKDRAAVESKVDARVISSAESESTFQDFVELIGFGHMQA